LRLPRRAARGAHSVRVFGSVARGLDREGSDLELTLSACNSTLRTRASAVPWRQIAGRRDRRIHAYFSVDLDAVWAMIEQDLPALKVQVRRIFAAMPGPGPPA
jgi:hypothetical protein